MHRCSSVQLAAYTVHSSNGLQTFAAGGWSPAGSPAALHLLETAPANGRQILMEAIFGRQVKTITREALKAFRLTPSRQK